MDENLVLSLDFTGKSAPAGLGYLPNGWHSAKVTNFKHFSEDGRSRVYVYMQSGGVSHRESFNISNENALPFLMAFLISAGVPEEKLAGKMDVPFHKLVGKTVWFNYTAPQLESTGKAVSGSYPRYTFYTKERYDAIQESLNLRPEDVKVEATGTASAATPSPAATKKAGGGDDFDFLLENNA